jgi:hypothetical protein
MRMRLLSAGTKRHCVELLPKTASTAPGPLTPAGSDRTPPSFGKIQVPAPARLAPPTGRPLTVGGVKHRAIRCVDLLPGDLIFTYKPHHKSLQQKLIALGQRFINWTDPPCGGCADVVHGFVVVAVQPQRATVTVVDAAAAGAYTVGIATQDLTFQAGTPNIDGHAYYLVYRLRHASARQAVARLALGWSSPNTQNFSLRSALLSPFIRRGATAHSQARLLHVEQALRLQRPVEAFRGRGLYKVMCTQCLSCILFAALAPDLRRLRAQQTLRPPAALGAQAEDLAALIDCNPKGMTPSVLQARRAHCAAVEAVGYLSPVSLCSPMSF